MKVFSSIPHDGAVKVSDVPPGHAFTPCSAPPIVFLRVDRVGALHTVANIACSLGSSFHIEKHGTYDLRAGVNLETGVLVMFFAEEMVIPLPSYLTTGKYEP